MKEAVASEPVVASAANAHKQSLPLNDVLLAEAGAGLFVQTKLSVGAPDDPLEREADSVADKVMRMPEQNFAQRKCAECEDEKKIQKKPEEEKDEPIQLKRETGTVFIQEKCAECEKEEKIQKKPEEEKEESVQLKRETSTVFIQEKCAECEKEEIHKKPLSETITPFVQTKSDEQSSEVNEELTSSIEGSRGSGTGMDNSTQSFMEQRIGADFSAVKIHSGPESVQMNRQLNAQAFTTGKDIYFNEGKYEPQTDDGKRLLAHELTHVVQQNTFAQNTPVQPKLAPGNSANHTENAVNETTSLPVENGLLIDKLQKKESLGLKSQQGAQTPPPDDKPTNKVNTGNLAPAGTIYLKREISSSNNVAGNSPGNAAPKSTPTASTTTTPGGNALTSNTAAKPASSTPQANKPAAVENKTTKKPDNTPTADVTKQPGAKGASVTNDPKQPPVIAATANPSDLLATLPSTPASQLPATLNEVKGAAGQSMQMQKADAVKLVPTVPESAGSPYGDAGGKTKYVAPKANASVKNTFEGKGGWEPPVLEEVNIPAPARFVPSNLTSRFAGAQASGSISSAAQSELNNITLNTDDLPEKLESPPEVELTGEAGLNNIAEEQEEQTSDLLKAKADAAKEIQNDFGENNVIPKPGPGVLKAKHSIKKPHGVNTSQLAAGFTGSPDISARLDASLAGQANQKIGEQTQKYQGEEIAYQQQLAEEKSKTDEQIHDETIKSKTTQNKAQQTAQKQVNDSRVDWQNQLNKTEADFKTNATTAAGKQIGEINKEANKGNVDAKKHYDDANKEAAEKTAASKKEAEEEKKKSEEDSGGFFGWLADAASFVIDKLKKAVNFIFDKLRAALKWVFDKAKKLAMAVIELVRKAIVGLIKGFGAILKGFIDIAFAAFPTIRDAINAKIDSAVDTAVTATNEAFDKFKEIVAAIIDTFAEIVDTILAVVQEALNIALSVIEFIVVGFIKVMAFLNDIEKQYALFKYMIDGFLLIWDHPEILEEKAKEFLDPYIQDIPGSAEGEIKKALALVGLATAKHITGIMKYLTPSINHLIANWWSEAKKMIWFLIWPFAEGSPLWEDAPKLWRLIPQMWNDLWDGEFSKVIDGGLEWMQALNMTVGAFAGWIVIGGVVIGAILGGIFGVGVGAIPGAGAGFEVGIAIGEGIMISMIATETAVIAKAVYDLIDTDDDEIESAPTPPKEQTAGEVHAAEANAQEEGPRQYTSGQVKTGRDRILYAYQRIANSGLTLGIMVALLLLGAIGGKIAQGLMAGLKKIGTVLGKAFPTVAKGLKATAGALKESKFGQGASRTAKAFGEGRKTMKGKIGGVKEKLGFGEPEKPTVPKEELPGGPKTEVEPLPKEVEPITKPEPKAKTEAEAEAKAKSEPEAKTADQQKAEDFAKKAQNDEGVANRGETKDGHKLKSDREGHIVECTDCKVYEISHREMLRENPELAKELKEIRERMTKAPEDPAVMKDLEAFDEKVKKIEYESFSEGGKKARDMGLPDAEPGYHWRANGDGEPLYVKNGATEGNQRVYDPATKSFKDFDGKAPRKIDVEAKYEQDPTSTKPKDRVEKIDTSGMKTDEAKALKETKVARDKALAERDKLSKGTDEYNKANKKVIDQSEKLGEQASDLAMKEKFGAEPDYTGRGSRTLDKVYTESVYLDEATGKVKVVDLDRVKVVEGKGGSADVGSKKVQGGKIAEQGTEPYLRETIREMKARGGEDARIASKIEAALDKGKLDYYKVTQKVDANGNLLPVEIKQFKLK
ncbi:MAG: hypothetical protein JWQ25_3162 [Daejeonella sp.]|nr:hypothetical protein [Daejeonella sp.]